MPVRSEHQVDVCIVGGGPAGLSAALVLARSRRSVLVVDAGEPRNAPAAAMHAYLTRDGLAPSEFLALGRAEVTRYGAQLLQGRVAAVERVDDRFRVDLDDRFRVDLDDRFRVDLHDRFRVDLDDGGTVLARRVVVTTGLVDELPDVPGLVDRWGRDVVHCPYCHGWEVRDRTIGVLVTSPMSWHQAGLFRQLSDRVMVLAHIGPTPDAQQAAELSARAVETIHGKVVAVEVHNDTLIGVVLADGRRVDLEVLVVAPWSVPRSGVLAALGLDAVAHPSGSGLHVPSDAMGATSVRGVWVAGNVTDPSAQVITAASQGNRAGAAVNADLVAEDEHLALEGA